MRGLFLVLEGISGSGKGTQVKALACELYERDKFAEVLLTREPSGGEWGRRGRAMRESDKAAGRDPRESAQQYLELYTQDTLDHCKRVVGPALESGVTVICDRYYHSRLTYQVQQGLDFASVLKVHRQPGIIKPDLTLILDVPAESALSRIDQARGERSQLERIEIMNDLAARYRALPEEVTDETIVVIDGSQASESVTAEMLAAVRKLRQ